jgi:structural maintenance of chromosome 4
MSLAINYIEIENFKSYYGKNILGPFHQVWPESYQFAALCYCSDLNLFQSLNLVIGPNGSGKSNVIDSLLFVFGFRAQKLRTKKISVLIHNSEKHQNVNSCSVTIFFHKIKEIVCIPLAVFGLLSHRRFPIAFKTAHTFEVVPDSEFRIKRTAYKDNSSDYYLNDRRVQYKEIQELLIGCGVDLDHNRFLILQVRLGFICENILGDYESVFNMKGRSRANIAPQAQSIQ